MGEVFRAFDLKLRVDLALKTLRSTLPGVERARRALRQEVRAAREVVSSNVCRVFDLVELEGLELVSMEFVDGVTLTDVLRERSPLGLQEARELASQFLAGLEAIHAAGLVHRDVKPENLMLTRAGRVVVMDFGIARALAEAQAGTVSGTPAYMAPEQARGEPADAGPTSSRREWSWPRWWRPPASEPRSARREVWRGVHHEPPQVGDSPWAAVLRKAVARQADGRYATAAALARALEEVTLRAAGDEALAAVPGPRVVQRSGRRVLRRARARGRGDVEEAAAAAPAGPDRPLRRGQDIVPAGGARPGAPAGLARHLRDARAIARSRRSRTRSPRSCRATPRPSPASSTSNSRTSRWTSRRAGGAATITPSWCSTSSRSCSP